MLRFGILTPEQYLKIGDRRRFSGARVAYNLLDVGDHPTTEQIRLFEDISFTLRTSNGTFRTTFRGRFQDIDAAAIRWMERLYPAASAIRVQDRAASHGLTSVEWAERLFRIFPAAELEVSDVLLDLVELSLPDGSAYIVEPDGTPLQYIRAPFVVPVYHQESRRYPVNRWLAARARRRFERLRLSSDWMHTGVDGCHIRRIPCVHPEVRRLAREDPSFTFRQRSVFDRTPGACDVLRTMNIFNKAYFSAVQLTEGAAVAFESLRPGGMWIVGRTLEADFTNHVTFFRRKDNGWEVLERIGQGSEIEDLALSAGAPAGRGRFA